MGEGLRALKDQLSDISFILLTAQGTIDTVRVSGSPANITSTIRERFYIRRARLKATIDPHPLTQAVIYLSSGTPIPVTLMEAYLTIRDP